MQFSLLLLTMSRIIEKSKNELTYSWGERVRLSIAALKLGYQAFIIDLQDLRDGGNISRSEYDRLHDWYLKRIEEFNARIGDLKFLTQKEVLPLEQQVRHILDTGIYLSNNPKGSSNGIRPTSALS
jgi:hypothetical protein